MLYTYIHINILCGCWNKHCNIFCFLCVGADRQKSRLTSCCAVWLQQRQTVPKITGKYRLWR